MNWELLFEKASKAFYTEFLADLVGLLVVILYFSKKNKPKSMVYLVIYTISGVLQSLVVQYKHALAAPTPLDTRIAHDSLYVYLMIELTCCLLFIKSHLRSRQFKRLILPGILFFNLFTIYYWLGKPSFEDFYMVVPTVEGFLIIIACVYFFYELLSGEPYKDLFTEPSFWAISGMLVLFTVITPVFLLLNYFIKNRDAMFYKLYATNNLSYTLLFVTFAVAIVSDKKQPERSTKFYS